MNEMEAWGKVVIEMEMQEAGEGVTEVVKHVASTLT